MDNKKITIISIILAALIILLIIIDCINSNRFKPVIIREPNIPRINRNDFVPNEIIISFKDSYTPLEVDVFIENLDNIKSYIKSSDESYLVEFYKDFDSPSEIFNYCNKLMDENDYISYCEPNYIIQLDECSKGPC